MAFSPCGACARHVLDGQACPFCGDTSERAPSRNHVVQVMTRAAFLVSTVALGAGCEATTPGPQPEPPVSVAPAYGAPVNTAPEPQPTTQPVPTQPTTQPVPTQPTAQPVPKQPTQPVTMAPAYGGPPAPMMSVTASPVAPPMAAYGAPPVPKPAPSNKPAPPKR